MKVWHTNNLNDTGWVFFDVFQRYEYNYTYRNIKSGRQLRANLRAGQYAWPGGYTMAFWTSDGAHLCFDCVQDNLYEVTWAIRHKCNDGWRVVGCELIEHYDEEAIRCEHCYKEIK